MVLIGGTEQRFFSETIFLGSHNRVIEAVLDGTVDAGATYSEAMDAAKDQRDDLMEKMRLKSQLRAGGKRWYIA